MPKWQKSKQASLFQNRLACFLFGPQSAIRLLRANDVIILSSVSLLLGYNGTFSLSQKSKVMFT